MKKIALLFVILGVLCAMAYAADGDYPKVKVSGKIYTFLATENNMSDYASFDQANAGKTNDARTYGRARVDMNFDMDIAKNVTGKVAARYEGGDTNDKWMYYGKGGDQLSKSTAKLQQAYVEVSNLFGQPLKFDLGRKQENFGAPGENDYGNVVAAKDKLDGIKVSYDNGNYYGNVHYYIIQRLATDATLDDVEGQQNTTLWGINGGLKDIGALKNGNLYFWNYTNPLVDVSDSTKLANDNRSVLGARGDFSVMDGMLTPFVEVALQFGKNKHTSVDENAWLLDFGTGYKQQFDAVTVDGGLRVLLLSGDDKNTLDKNESWQGFGLANWEEGWKWTNPVKSDYNMFKVSLGVTPSAMDKLRLGFDGWMYTDASKNYGDDISGKNVFNEVGLNAAYSVVKNVKVKAGVNLLLPNKDYQNAKLGTAVDHGDMAHALWFETDVKW